MNRDEVIRLNIQRELNELQRKIGVLSVRRDILTDLLCQDIKPVPTNLEVRDNNCYSSSMVLCEYCFDWWDDGESEKSYYDADYNNVCPECAVGQPNNMRRYLAWEGSVTKQSPNYNAGIVTRDCQDNDFPMYDAEETK